MYESRWGSTLVGLVLAATARIDRLHFADMQVVDPSNSSWCLMDQDTHKSPATQSKPSSTSSGSSNTGSSGRLVAAPRGAISRTDKVLSITLALPDPTEEEVMYKKGGVARMAHSAAGLTYTSRSALRVMLMCRSVTGCFLWHTLQDKCHTSDACFSSVMFAILNVLC